MTVGDINNVTFEKAMRGYRPEDVDDFLAKVAQEFEALTAERDEALREQEETRAAAQQEKEAMEKKLYILAEKIEQYRADEENLKMTLLNAQRMGDTVVNEAKQKAENLLYDAKTKAAQMHEEIKSQIVAEEAHLAHLKKEVNKFRTDVLSAYQRHMEVVSTIPTLEEKKLAAAFPAVRASEQEKSYFAAPKTAPKPEPAAVVPEQPKAPAAAPVEAPVEEPIAEQQPVRSEIPEVEQPSFETAVPATPLDSFENYQGIDFEE